MKKVFLTMILAVFSAAASFSMSEYRTHLMSVNEDIGVIADSPSIVRGSSGVVLRSFGNGLKSIIARAVVDSKHTSTANVRFEVYSALKQSSLPVPNFTPQAGDEVVLNYLYDRSLIIAPNAEVYNQVVEVFSNITFVHPDLVGAMLSMDYKPNPSQDDFRRACALNAAGLIFIALDGKSMFVDCGSFSILKSFKSGQIAQYHLPFYTRVRDINTVFWKLDSEHINNYDKYYRFLLNTDENTGKIESTK
ncbi:MAG: plasminogen-binding N-terminal domain-containing protein [Campylobacter sp.]|uniref:plasminogen-binding N-terminal domain-containing protein n=1 Tax=Campylobacter sp. TaxID=205 RepID=UPI002AA7147F|nr:plasminogen-binding N-terminal domain-containing protein [Campylobacter sp.]MCI7023416.1 plasminogen-binding N-terminal domain-containing protein [Campylobacter sp.]